MAVEKTDAVNTENTSWSYTKLIKKKRVARKYIWTKKKRQEGADV